MFALQNGSCPLHKCCVGDVILFAMQRASPTVPSWSVGDHARCGATEQFCAFRSCTSEEKYCLHDAKPDDLNNLPPPQRHALIIGRPSRYPLAAAEALRAGFQPKLIPGIFQSYSRCIPDPAKYTIPRGPVSHGQMSERIKLDNLVEAQTNALRHIVATNTPHAVFEDDIVLLTSRNEVQSWLDGRDNRLVRTTDRALGTLIPGTGLVRNQSFARHEFDLVPLGSCGAGTKLRGSHDKFACGHALWFTPAGAKALLDLMVDCPYEPTERMTLEPAGRKVALIDVNFYINHDAPKVARVCSTKCAPDRKLTPACWDDEAEIVHRNRECSLPYSECPRKDTLRCLDWRELKTFSTGQKGMDGSLGLIQKGNHFHPRRYLGYGHFAQDPMRSHESIVVDMQGNVVSAPTYSFNQNKGYFHQGALERTDSEKAYTSGHKPLPFASTFADYSACGSEAAFDRDRLPFHWLPGFPVPAPRPIDFYATASRLEVSHTRPAANSKGLPSQGLLRLYGAVGSGVWWNPGRRLVARNIVDFVLKRNELSAVVRHFELKFKHNTKFRAAREHVRRWQVAYRNDSWETILTGAAEGRDCYPLFATPFNLFFGLKGMPESGSALSSWRRNMSHSLDSLILVEQSQFWPRPADQNGAKPFADAIKIVDACRQGRHHSRQHYVPEIFDFRHAEPLALIRSDDVSPKGDGMGRCRVGDEKTATLCTSCNVEGYVLCKCASIFKEAARSNETVTSKVGLRHCCATGMAHVRRRQRQGVLADVKEVRGLLDPVAPL